MLLCALCQELVLRESKIVKKGEAGDMTKLASPSQSRRSTCAWFQLKQRPFPNDTPVQHRQQCWQWLVEVTQEQEKRSEHWRCYSRTLYRWCSRFWRVPCCPSYPDTSRPVLPCRCSPGWSESGLLPDKRLKLDCSTTSTVSEINSPKKMYSPAASSI